MPSIEDQRSLRWLRLLLWAVFLLGVGACVSRGADEPADPVVVTPSSDAGGSTSAPDGDPSFVDAFGTVRAMITTLDGEPIDFCLLLADTGERRQRGLMEVTDPDLGGFDGMLFRFDAADDVGFWMRNTPMPLSIAYFAADGALLTTADMEPCPDDPSCPTYPAGGPVLWAIEVPQGQLPGLGITPGSTLTDTAEPCTPAG